MTAENQRANVRVAAEALAPVAQEHELVISHGNGPQVGLLALQGAAYKEVETYPLDVLGAQTEGMIGYLIEQELGNLLPFEKPFATVLTMVEVDPDDQAFSHPDKFIGPVYERAEAERLAQEKGWAIKHDGDKWRRVVPSPMPKRIFEIRPIEWLLERGAVVICTGGGGVPTMYERGTKRLIGAEVVVDKDRASALLARELEADLFVMATDVDGVYRGFGTAQQQKIDRATAGELAGEGFAAGSMGPKVEAAVDFVRRTGNRAAIGTLAEIGGVVAGTHGTSVTRD
jgi:carbamate kinase